MKEKKLIAILMIIMVTFVFSVVPVSAASKKVKLSKTKITLQVKASKKLKITGTKKKVKWSVSKKLVTIKTKGKKKHTAVIKAGKKAGTCWVIAKVGKKKYKCKVVIKKKKKDEGHGAVVTPPAVEKPTPVEPKPISDEAVNLTKAYSAQSVTLLNADAAFTNAMSETAVKLLQKTAAGDSSNGNLLISPDSILTAMAMTELGTAGDTRAEMETAFGGIEAEDYSKYLAKLNKKLISSKGVSYHIADSIWFKKGNIIMKPGFLQQNVNYHSAEIYEAPFDTGTVKDINNWVYNNTNGMIPSILDDLDADARFALINAIAFEGRWSNEFGDPVKKTFTKANGSKQTVNMLMGTEHTYLEVNGGVGFVKPYTGGEIAFLGLLPPEGTSVENFVQGLTGKALMKAYANRTTEGLDVHIWLPEFKYDYSASLETVLQEMGIQKAFQGDADFSAMTDQPVCIDRVLHKTHIELNQYGTKAAAATAVIGKAGAAMPQKTVDIHLDRPFVYAIIDTETGLPLFLGYVKEI